MSARLVLGLDVGGTSTRALAVDADSGERLGTGRANGANPVSHGVPRAAENIGSALKQALAGRDPAEVARCVVGMAGASKLAAQPETAAAFAELWHVVGLRCPVEVVSDVTAAFVAGTPEPDGSVLVAGTGAVAAAMAARRPRRWCDGHGWLLGDDGSGFWIGRQAVRAALAALEGREQITPLTAAVVVKALGTAPGAEAVHERVLWPEIDPDQSSDPSRFGSDTSVSGERTAPSELDLSQFPDSQRLGPEGSVSAGRSILPPGFALDQSPDPEQRRSIASAVIATVNEHPPVELAGYAFLAAGCAIAGDPVAARIVASAADHLIAALGHIREPGARTPIVLGGGILRPALRIDRTVRAALAAAWPDAPVLAATDGAAGAAWLAALALLEDGAEGAAASARARILHTRLTAEGRT